MAELQKTAALRLVRLRAGYRRFDGTRGMDYILDLEVQPETGGATQIRRVEVHRPILKAELVPIPFVTERPIVLILLPVQWDQVPRAVSFVRQLIDKNENVALMLFLIPGEYDPSVFDSLRKLVKQANDRRSAKPERKFGSVVWPHRAPPTQFEMADTASAETGYLWNKTVVLLLDQPIEFNSELLNRVSDAGGGGGHRGRGGLSGVGPSGRELLVPVGRVLRGAEWWRRWAETKGGATARRLGGGRAEDHMTSILSLHRP